VLLWLFRPLEQRDINSLTYLLTNQWLAVEDKQVPLSLFCTLVFDKCWFVSVGILLSS